MSHPSVQIVPLNEGEKVDLPGGSWSRMLITDSRVTGNKSFMGYSVFKPGTETAPVAHEVEEVAYVISGKGALRLDDGEKAFKEGDALCIPAGVWHGVANTGDEDVVMAFSFPFPRYPVTERRS